MAEDREPTPTIPVGLDAYRDWDRWPYQRIGARAYMRSTYDRTGGNRSADASHFLYQQSDDFNVTLDVEGPGILYFARYNHWHGSPWHYEVDGKNYIVQESSTPTPNQPVANSAFIPQHLFPNPLVWTWSTTKGADLMWVPIGFENRFRMAYSRTRYGTGYYIYHQYVDGANLSHSIEAWDGQTPPDPAVLELVDRSGTDIAPRQDTPEGRELGVQERSGVAKLAAGDSTVLALLSGHPAMVRALEFSVPRDRALEFGRCRIRVTWDDREHPSIDAPVGLFFGTGTLYNRGDKEHLVKAFPMNVRFDDERVHLACYFPMPFFRSAKFELINTATMDGDEDLSDIRWSIRTHPYADPLNHVAYFHATYRDHPNPELGHDMVWLDTREAEGGGDWSGHFVGTSFIFTDRAYLGTLEGDPRFFFDGSQTPQAYGTGTEEWGGGGDYWGGLAMTLPFAGHPVGAPPDQARNDEDRIHSAYRFLLADLMPFGNRAVIRFEHGAHNESREHYQTVVYWYGVPSATLVKTDQLEIGDRVSEEAHRYHSPDASEPYELTSRYEWGVDTLDIEGPRAEPDDFVEFEFEADADKTYHIWVRGKSNGGTFSDATWFQFDDLVGTRRLGDSYDHDKGIGNWRDFVPPDTYAWCSALPDAPPQTVLFAGAEPRRLRIQPRHAPHVIDQIWLSATQDSRPDFSEPVAKPLPRQEGEPIDEVVLDISDADTLRGSFEAIADPDASIGNALRVVGEGDSRQIEVFPAHTEVGRTTTSASEFTLDLRSDNLGVLLRRTLDYGFPNQRARVYVADPATSDVGGSGNDRSRNELDWQLAGVWYLAGSNSCVYSDPPTELGETRHEVVTSNRRFRDDEFLIPRQLTAGREAIRIRVEFMPVEIPLFPGHPLGELAWSEIRYAAYCFVMPEIEQPEGER